MDTYYTLGKMVVAIALLVQLSLLAIYAGALKRHRNLCFSLLASGAVVGLVYAIVAGLPFFLHWGLPVRLLIAKVTFALLVVGGVLGVWGMALLVRSYSALAGHVLGASDARA